jgi:putative holliday junction resolvase
MPRIVAIDYGGKRTGIAVSDPLQIIATALETVPTKELFSFLKEYSSKEEIESFVVGEPKNLDGSDTDASQMVRNFLVQLKSQFPEKPIHLIDERFTSKMAMQSLIASGTKKKDRKVKGNIDKVSATIILQDFMSR